MLPTASSSSETTLPATSRSRLALIRDVVPESPRQAGVNPLIDAAAPIFSYLRSLRQLHEVSDIALLKKKSGKKIKNVCRKNSARCTAGRSCGVMSLCTLSHHR